MFWKALGWGSVGTVCRGSRSSAVNSVAYDYGGNDNVIGTIAHEMGKFIFSISFFLVALNSKRQSIYPMNDSQVTISV